MQKQTETNSSANPLLLFASAFSLGAFFAYFSSEAGSKKWQELSEKWESARDYLHQQGLLKDKNLSLEDFRRQYLGQLSTSFAAMKAAFENKTVEKELAHLAKLKRRRTAAKKQKFKGV
jgi:hypothetical protein